MLIVATKGSVIRGGKVIIRIVLRENSAFPSYFGFLNASCFCVQLLKLFHLFPLLYIISFITYKVSYIIYKVSYIFCLLLTYTCVFFTKNPYLPYFYLLGTSNKYKRDEVNLYSLFAFLLLIKKTLNLFPNSVKSIKLYIFALNPLFLSIIIAFSL